MSLPEVRPIYGVHSFSPYDRVTGVPKGLLRVLGSSGLSLTGELNKLNGGSSKYPFAVEEGLITAELNLVTREFPNFLFELFGGKAPTEAIGGADAVNGFVNKKGVTTKDAVTGIDDVTIAVGADLKFTKYAIVVVSATTVDVYALTNIDFRRGSDGDFIDGSLKVNAAPLTIIASTSTPVPNFGIQLDGGSGAIAMTIGDTAIFEVFPAGDQMNVTIGALEDEFPEFGALLYAKKLSDGSLWEIDALRCKGAGIPLGLEENTFNEAEIPVECFQDSVQNAVLKLRRLQ